MENPFLIDRSFRVRHKILGVLHDDLNQNGMDYERRVGSIRVASITKIHIDEIHKWQHLLVEKGEIVIADNDGQSIISILPAGNNAYIDKRYLKDGRKEKWDNIFNWARIIIPLGALILSIINFISNSNISARIKVLEEKRKTINK